MSSPPEVTILVASAPEPVPANVNPSAVSEEKTRPPEDKIRRMSPPSPQRFMRSKSFEGIRNAQVVDYRIEKTNSKRFALFRINVQKDARHWTIHRRYSDFTDLHSLLSHTYDKETIAKLALPKKRLWNKKDKFDPTDMEERRQQLQHYLNVLLDTTTLANEPVVADFLSNNWRKPSRTGLPSHNRAKLARWDAQSSNRELVDAQMAPHQIKRIVARTQQRRAARKKTPSATPSADKQDTYDTKVVHKDETTRPRRSSPTKATDTKIPLNIRGSDDSDSGDDSGESSSDGSSDEEDEEGVVIVVEEENTEQRQRTTDSNGREPSRLNEQQSSNTTEENNIIVAQVPKKRISAFKRHPRYRAVVSILVSDRGIPVKGTPPIPTSLNTNGTEWGLREWLEGHPTVTLPHKPPRKPSWDAEYYDTFTMANTPSLPIGYMSAAFPSKKEVARLERRSSGALERRTSVGAKSIRRTPSIPITNANEHTSLLPLESSLPATSPIAKTTFSVPQAKQRPSTPPPPPPSSTSSST